MESGLDGARRDWEEGHRRFETASRDDGQAERLGRQREVVTAELRRRVGGTFTLAMLADAYAGSDAWARQAIEEHEATPGWARSVAMVGDAAFHVYARGAVDYTP
jgi:chorismate-pyruvate lyase